MISETMFIGGNEVNPGEQKHLKLTVGALPSGTRIHINVHVYRAQNPGPSVLLLGGLHGDEVNGVEIVRRTIASGILDGLKKGTVIAIPLLNVYGFINFSRSVRDGKDVNRSFPGTKKGSLASRVAFLMTNEILPNIDFGMDFHTGGSTIDNHPQVRVSDGDEVALKLAKSFAPPIILKNTPIPKSHRLQAMKMGKPILVFEGGESLRLSENSIQVGVDGISRVLKSSKMIDSDVAKGKSKIYAISKWVRAPKSGLVNLNVKSSDTVKKGQVLAEIHHLDSLKKIEVKSPANGIIAAHVNNPVVSRGDALFHLMF